MNFGDVQKDYNVSIMYVTYMLKHVYTFIFLCVYPVGGREETLIPVTFYLLCETRL